MPLLDPSVGTNKTIRQTAHVSLPVTNKEVEVVRSIARGSRRFTSRRRQDAQLQDREPVNRAHFHKSTRLKLSRRSVTDTSRTYANENKIDLKMKPGQLRSNTC